MKERIGLEVFLGFFFLNDWEYRIMVIKLSLFKGVIMWKEMLGILL